MSPFEKDCRRNMPYFAGNTCKILFVTSIYLLNFPIFSYVHSSLFRFPLFILMRYLLKVDFRSSIICITQYNLKKGLITTAAIGYSSQKQWYYSVVYFYKEQSPGIAAR